MHLRTDREGKLICRLTNPIGASIATRLDGEIPVDRDEASDHGCHKQYHTLHRSVEGCVVCIYWDRTGSSKFALDSCCVSSRVPQVLQDERISMMVAVAGQDGALFLDRDPDLFDWVLRFARTGEIQKDMPGALQARQVPFFLYGDPCTVGGNFGMYLPTTLLGFCSAHQGHLSDSPPASAKAEFDFLLLEWPPCCQRCGVYFDVARLMDAV